jgi:hypothetical protein
LVGKGGVTLEPVINEIIIVSGCGVRGYKVGERLNDEDIITKIEDQSYETDNYTCCIYDVYSGDKRIARIENCPVEIRYK